MRQVSKRVVMALGVGVTTVVVAVLALAWGSLTYKPSFYRAMVELPVEQRQEKAKRFVAQSLQLRNDIHNEPRWEAVFTDEEVNAWLAEDLVTHFADQIPPDVHNPRIAFDMDRVTLAFQLDQGPLRSVIWVVARVRVPEENMLALTIEKIRAGMVPVSADTILARITQHAREHGLDLYWETEENLPVAIIRYQANPDHDDVVLEGLRISNGQIRMSGRSRRPSDGEGNESLVQPIVLPQRRVLQSTFPVRQRNTQSRAGRGGGASSSLNAPPPVSLRDDERSRSTSPTS